MEIEADTEQLVCGDRGRPGRWSIVTGACLVSGQR